MLNFLIFTIFTAFSLYVLVLSVLNIMTIRLQTGKAVLTSGPLVSVMIPARDEEHAIQACLDSLLKQTYQDYEVLVIDDQSSDNTWEIVSEYAKQHTHIHAFKGRGLPEGWNGKTYALHQLAQHAKGEIFLFTDADTIHGPESISLGVSNLVSRKTDMVSGYPNQAGPDFITRLIVSVMLFNTAFLFPLVLSRLSRIPIFALAIGQYICIKRDAYFASGGYERIRSRVTDDIHLARSLISQGYRIRFIGVHHTVKCRMYGRPAQAFAGITRSIVDFFDCRTSLLISSAVLFCCLIIYPVLACFWFLFQGIVMIPLVFGLLAVSLSWAVVILYLRYPLSAALFGIIILVLPVIMGFYGSALLLSGRGIVWKKRYVA